MHWLINQSIGEWVDEPISWLINELNNSLMNLGPFSAGPLWLILFDRYKIDTTIYILKYKVRWLGPRPLKSPHGVRWFGPPSAAAAIYIYIYIYSYIHIRKSLLSIAFESSRRDLQLVSHWHYRKTSYFIKKWDISIYTCIYIHIYINIYICICHIYIHIYACMHLCVVSIYAYLSIWICVRLSYTTISTKMSWGDSGKITSSPHTISQSAYVGETLIRTGGSNWKPMKR